MGDVVAERGVSAATVANVVARAGVSRRTFYELFADREDCFLATFDHAAALAAETVISAYQGQAQWHDRIRAGLTALLEFLDEEPALGALVAVHALAGGPTALERRAQIIDILIVAVDEGRKAHPGRASHGAARKSSQQPAPLTAEGVVGAVLAVIHARLSQPLHERRASESLTGLLAPLMSAIVLPYLGADAAAKELGRPTLPSKARPRRGSRDPLKELDMRLTYRTVRVLIAISTIPGASNRQVGDAAGIADQGQISKLLARLTTLGLVENRAAGQARGEANAWHLTTKGQEVDRTIRAEATTPAR